MELNGSECMLLKNVEISSKSMLLKKQNMIWSFQARTGFFLLGYPYRISPSAFVQTALLEETVHTIQFDEGWRHGCPHACLLPARCPTEPGLQL